VLPAFESVDGGSDKTIQVIQRRWFKMLTPTPVQSGITPMARLGIVRQDIVG